MTMGPPSPGDVYLLRSPLSPMVKDWRLVRMTNLFLKMVHSLLLTLLALCPMEVSRPRSTS